MEPASLSDYVNNPDDLRLNEDEGQNGIAVLIEEYKRKANNGAAPSGPLQSKPCVTPSSRPTLQELIDATDQVRDVKMVAHRGLKQHKIITPVLRNGRRVALRIQHMAPPLKELRQYEDKAPEAPNPTSSDKSVHDRIPYNENHLYAHSPNSAKRNDQVLLGWNDQARPRVFQCAERRPQRNPLSTCHMQTVHADLSTNMPLTISEDTIIFVCIDAFTGWLMLSAHGHKGSDTIARELYDDVFLKFGIL